MLCSKCGRNNVLGNKRCVHCNGLLWKWSNSLPPSSRARRVIDLALSNAIWPLLVAVVFFAAYLALGIIVPGPEALLFTCKFIALPLALAVLYWQRRRWVRHASRPSYVNLFVGYIVLLFVSLTAIKWINAAFLTDQILVIEGTVTKLEPNRRSGSSVYLRSSDYEHDYRLIVPPGEFSKLQLNSHYGVCFQVGWLGIPFRWRHHNNGACSLIHRPAG